MDKQALLKEVYESSFNTELEKIALKPRTIASAGGKALDKLTPVMQRSSPDRLRSAEGAIKILKNSKEYSKSQISNSRKTVQGLLSASNLKKYGR